MFLCVLLKNVSRFIPVLMKGEAELVYLELD